MLGDRDKVGTRRVGRVAWSAGSLMFGAALVAKQFVGEPDWIGTLGQSGALLVGVGVAMDLARGVAGEAAYTAGVCLAVGAALLLGLVNGAVGIIGSEDEAANLMYWVVPLVGIIGSVIARLRPRGMARALAATAVVQALVGAVALVGQMGAPASGPFELVTINGFFVALFAGAAVLFSRSEPNPAARVAV
jgi:hypothetical protein